MVEADISIRTPSVTVDLLGGWASGAGNYCPEVRSIPVAARAIIAQGRDASDVPITMVFGKHFLEKFVVITEEVDSG
jgi:hypothetical protein